MQRGPDLLLGAPYIVSVLHNKHFHHAVSTFSISGHGTRAQLSRQSKPEGTLILHVYHD